MWIGGPLAECDEGLSLASIARAGGIRDDVLSAADLFDAVFDEQTKLVDIEPCVYRKRYPDLLNPRSSSITAFGPIGTRPGFARPSLRNTILSRQTLRRKSSKT